MTQLFNNARIVLADRVIERGALAVNNGLISAIHDTVQAHATAIDCHGDDLIPGLIEIHTDNLEKHLMPRNEVLWPTLPAVIIHDAQCVAAGITTVFDALAVGDLEGESVRLDTLNSAIAAIDDGNRLGLFRAGHLLHLRCELAYPALLDTLQTLIDHPALRLISLMDHTPGQRQYRDLAQYQKYYARKNVSWNADTFASAVAQRCALQARHAAAHRQAIVALAQARGIALASHDDTEPQHIDDAVRDGMLIAEFPTTMAAAAAARAAGLLTVMGAPNVIRGGSHSGNIDAVSLARAGLLDILSSDYVPASLLHAAYLLTEQAGWSLPQAVASISSQPARAVGLHDRGSLRCGARADLVRVHHAGPLPLVREVWRTGRRVY